MTTCDDNAPDATCPRCAGKPWFRDDLCSACEAVIADSDPVGPFPQEPAFGSPEAVAQAAAATLRIEDEHCLEGARLCGEMGGISGLGSVRAEHPALAPSEFQDHTPGPWAEDGAVDTTTGRPYQANGDRRRYHEISTLFSVGSEPAEGNALRFTICTTLDRDRDITNDEDAANARLIAAAPDLLRERDELRAEMERLRAELGATMDADTAAFQGGRKALDAASAEIDRLRDQLSRLREETNARISDLVADREAVDEALEGVRGQRDALADALELIRSAEDWTDTYCEFCEAHAPKHTTGMRDGQPLGPIPHKEECPRAATQAALRLAGRLP